MLKDNYKVYSDPISVEMKFTMKNKFKTQSWFPCLFVFINFLLKNFCEQLLPHFKALHNAYWQFSVLVCPSLCCKILLCIRLRPTNINYKRESWRWRRRWNFLLSFMLKPQNFTILSLCRLIFADTTKDLGEKLEVLTKARVLPASPHLFFFVRFNKKGIIPNKQPLWSFQIKLHKTFIHSSIQHLNYTKLINIHVLVPLHQFIVHGV